MSLRMIDSRRPKVLRVARNPTVNDDSSTGFQVFSLFQNTNTGEIYICSDNSAGAAVWSEMGSGGGSHADTRDPTSTDDAGAGFQAGSLWVNTVNLTLWVSVVDTDDNAVWRNNTDLAHLYPYVVGPVGLAPYQAIQSAIDQALADGMTPSSPRTVWVLNGTYNENLTLHPGLILRAVDYKPTNVEIVIEEPEVVINGTLTLNNTLVSAAGAFVYLQGLKVTAPSGSFVLAVTSSVAELVNVLLTGCYLRSTNSDILSLVKGSANKISVLATLTFFYAHPGRVGRIVTGCSLTLRNCRSNITGETRSVVLAGGTFLAYQDLPTADEGTFFNAPIEIEAATTGLLTLSSVGFFQAIGSDVIVDGSLSAASYYRDCFSILTKKSITVGGVNADQFVEVPLANAGTVKRYDGYRWRQVRNNYTATADPVAGDDNTQGYAVGSWWFRTDTSEWFICLDASTGAAVWREVSTGGGGSTHVDTVDPTVNDDQTQGYDPGDFWLNTVDRDLFVCVSAATGAALWIVVPTGRKIRLQTTNETLTLAGSITLADPETAIVDVFVTARRTDSGTDHAAYQRKAVAYRNGAGAVMIGTVDTPLTRETDTSWNVALTVSGNDLQINVQGASGQTIEWRVRYTLERM